MTNQNILLSSFTLEELKSIIGDCVRMAMPPNPVPPISHEEDFITESQAQRLLLVSKVTLKKWRDEKRIKYYRIGSRIRYKRSELLQSCEIPKQRRNSK